MKDFLTFAVITVVLLAMLYLGKRVWDKYPNQQSYSHTWEVFQTSHGEVMRLRVWGGWLVSHQNSITFVGPLQNPDGWVLNK